MHIVTLVDCMAVRKVLADLFCRTHVVLGYNTSQLQKWAIQRRFDRIPNIPDRWMIVRSEQSTGDVEVDAAYDASTVLEQNSLVEKIALRFDSAIIPWGSWMGFRGIAFVTSDPVLADTVEGEVERAGGVSEETSLLDLVVSRRIFRAAARDFGRGCVVADMNGLAAEIGRWITEDVVVIAPTIRWSTRINSPNSPQGPWATTHVAELESQKVGDFGTDLSIYMPRSNEDLRILLRSSSAHLASRTLVAPASELLRIEGVAQMWTQIDLLEAREKALDLSLACTRHLAERLTWCCMVGWAYPDPYVAFISQDRDLTQKIVDASVGDISFFSLI